LLPQRFPFRRDVELHAELTEGGDRIVFYDHFWLTRSVLAACVVSVNGNGLEAAMAASSLRELLRASLKVTRSPEAALAVCRDRHPSFPIDIAIAVVDLVEARLTTAASGSASITTR